MDSSATERSSAYARLRQRMVDEQIRDRGITDQRVLDALRAVPREEFVRDDLRDEAYADGPLPIGCLQTISQPFTVAFMCAALQLRGDEKVLEIGAGSGYSAAVLSHLAREVFTIERIPQLAESARRRLARLGYKNVHVVTGDGTLGLPSAAPFDAIVVTAGAHALPPAYVDQLREQGRIVIPIGADRYCQLMQRFTKRPSGLQVESLGDFAFVPLIGEHGWSETDNGG